KDSPAAFAVTMAAAMAIARQVLRNLAGRFIIVLRQSSPRAGPAATSLYCRDHAGRDARSPRLGGFSLVFGSPGLSGGLSPGFSAFWGILKDASSTGTSSSNLSTVICACVCPLTFCSIENGNRTPLTGL